MIVIQGMLLWHFHIYICCIPVWFILSTILPLPTFPFLRWLQQVSVFHSHVCTERTSTTFPLPLHLTQPMLHSCPSSFKCLFWFSGDFDWCFTYKYIVLKSVSPPPLLCLTLFPYPVWFGSCQCVSWCLVPTHVMNLIIIHSFFPPLSLL
jgi:hypothetical protein